MNAKDGVRLASGLSMFFPCFSQAPSTLKSFSPFLLSPGRKDATGAGHPDVPSKNMSASARQGC